MVRHLGAKVTVSAMQTHIGSTRAMVLAPIEFETIAATNAAKIDPAEIEAEDTGTAIGIRITVANGDGTEVEIGIVTETETETVTVTGTGTAIVTETETVIETAIENGLANDRGT